MASRIGSKSSGRDEAGLEFVGQSDAPGRAGRDLFALNEAVVQVTVER